MKKSNTKSVVDFYSLSAVLNNGADFDFAELKGKKVILVNTASNCGYTNQYAELQQLHETMGDTLQVIGFPANDFKEQEQGDDAAINEFCQINFGVNFPLAKKSVVVKKEGQHPVFSWLSDAAKNGWNVSEPVWNFTKYVVDEEGNLTHYFGPSISPMDEKFLDALE